MARYDTRTVMYNTHLLGGPALKLCGLQKHGNRKDKIVTVKKLSPFCTAVFFSCKRTGSGLMTHLVL